MGGWVGEDYQLLLRCVDNNYSLSLFLCRKLNLKRKKITLTFL